MQKSLFLLVILALIIGCKKKGCMDVDADNYNSSATKEDYTQCSYTKTYIPDNNFENYLENLNLGDGIRDNDSVLTNKLIEVDSLNLMWLGITDISGIEHFVNLTYLNIGSSSNSISEIDVSNNKLLETLYCFYQPINTIDLSNNTALKILGLSYTNLTSIDVSNNPLIEELTFAHTAINSIDLSNNSLLNFFSCSSSSITELDLSNNNLLKQVYCSESPLEKLDLRNGNNSNLEYIWAHNNSNLSCISVDDSAWSTSNWIGINFEFDNQVSFSNNCQ